MDKKFIFIGLSSIGLCIAMLVINPGLNTIHTNVYNYDEAHRKELQKRLDKVSTVCEKNSAYLRRVNGSFINWQYLVDNEHKLMYCRQAKVGTSTLLHYFDVLSPLDNLTNVDLLHRAVPKRYAKELRSNVGKNALFSPLQLKNYLDKMGIMSFSFVRHPLDRLVLQSVHDLMDFLDPTFLIP